MKDIKSPQPNKADKDLRQVMLENGVDADTVGRFIMDHVEGDRAINELQKTNIDKNNYYKRKDYLMQMELFAIMLLKK